MKKKWTVEVIASFEMESDKEWGPTGEEAIQEITNRIPQLESKQLEFFSSEEL